jgi:hypothetical protein
MSVISGSAVLGWHSGTSGQDYFVVQRSTSGGGFSQISTPVTTSLTDTSVSSSIGGNTYAYKAAAVNVAGTSSFSNTATITFTSAAPMVPALIPQLFTSSIDTGSIYFSNLMWNPYRFSGNASGSATGSSGVIGNYILSSSYSGAIETASIGFATEIFALSPIVINPTWRYDFYNDPVGNPNNYYTLIVEVNGVVETIPPSFGYPDWGTFTGFVQPVSMYTLHTGSNTVTWSIYLNSAVAQSDISGTISF